MNDEVTKKKNIHFFKWIFVVFFLVAKRARLNEQAAAEEHRRRAALETVLPDLLRSNRETEDMNGDNQNDTGGPEEYLDLLLDEEETFIREYRQRLIDDGFW